VELRNVRRSAVLIAAVAGAVPVVAVVEEVADVADQAAVVAEATVVAVGEGTKTLATD